MDATTAAGLFPALLHPIIVLSSISLLLHRALFASTQLTPLARKRVFPVLFYLIVMALPRAVVTPVARAFKRSPLDAEFPWLAVSQVFSILIVMWTVRKTRKELKRLQREREEDERGRRSRVYEGRDEHQPMTWKEMGAWALYYAVWFTSIGLLIMAAVSKSFVRSAPVVPMSELVMVIITQIYLLFATLYLWWPVLRRPPGGLAATPLVLSRLLWIVPAALLIAPIALLPQLLCILEVWNPTALSPSSTDPQLGVTAAMGIWMTLSGVLEVWVALLWCADVPVSRWNVAIRLGAGLGLIPVQESAAGGGIADEDTLVVAIATEAVNRSNWKSAAMTTTYPDRPGTPQKHQDTLEEPKWHDTPERPSTVQQRRPTFSDWSTMLAMP